MKDRTKFNLKAIFAGWATDTAGHFIAGMFFPLAVFLWFYFSRTVTVPEKMDEIARLLEGSVFFQILTTIVVVLLPSALAGYVAARVSRVAELRHAFLVGVLSLLTAIVLSPLVREITNVDVNLVYSLLTVPSALIGGYARIVQERQIKR